MKKYENILDQVKIAIEEKTFSLEALQAISELRKEHQELEEANAYLVKMRDIEAKESIAVERELSKLSKELDGAELKTIKLKEENEKQKNELLAFASTTQRERANEIKEIMFKMLDNVSYRKRITGSQPVPTAVDSSNGYTAYGSVEQHTFAEETEITEA